MEEILVQLERLAQAFPWEKVALEIAREPDGRITLAVWLLGNEKLGLPYEINRGETIPEAVDLAIVTHQANRDPNAARERKVKELQEQLQKLESAVFNLPPYRPNRELCERNPELRNYRSAIQAPIDVSSNSQAYVKAVFDPRRFNQNQE